MMARNVVENVVKQGYLKKGNYGASRLSGLFRRNEVNKWFVFTIRQGIPFLEYYDTELDVFTQHPINSFNLSSCQNVKSMGNTNPPSFCIVCPDRVIELIASSRTQMVEWVNEVEASLTRLGILKNEVVDHVYTVCPAVVRKPRISKDDINEPDKDVLLVEANISESSASSSSSAVPPPPPRGQLLRQHTIAEKPSSRPPLSRSSCSFHGTSDSHSLGIVPPPLPQRSSSQIARTSSHKETDETTASEHKENPYVHQTPEGSNDSDFVSPEVIAELRQQSQASRRATLERVLESTNISPPDTPTDTYIVMNKSYFECSVPESTLPPERTRPKTGAEPSETSRDSSGSLNLEHESELRSSLTSISNMVADCLGRPEDVSENDYSVFPCQQGPSDMLTNSTDVNSGGSNLGGSIVSKPTPVPRKALSKVFPSPGDLAVESSPPVSECNSVPVSLNCDVVPVPDEMYVLPDKEIVVNETINSYEDEYTTLIQPPVENHYNNILSISWDGDKAGTSNSQPFSVKQGETNPSKDENENFYGLVFNDEPPTTLAPPIPAIPPLPPRQSSFYSKGEGCKPTVTQHSKSGLLFPDTDNTYSYLPTSAFSAAAPSGKHRSLPSDLSYVPPLPIPRKSGSNYDSLRKSLPTSAFTSNGFLDIPPMPPRLTSPHFPQSQEDQPPALPSRNTQSFFIKRPQLTGLSGNVKSSGDDMFGQKNASFTSDDHPSSTERKVHETNTSTSKLSKKMLLDRSHSLHTVVSLKQTQAEILQAEISMASVAVSIAQKAGSGIALVDWNNSPCVVGWNQHDFPSLHGKLHLGDLIYSINNVRVTSSETAHKLLKHAPSSNIEILLHRMPYAKVFAIHRNAEGQSLGFKRDRGTGEIVYVDPNGLAAQHGLTSHAPSAFGSDKCNWFLTEINNRPLNLFYKENEIDHRLSAVGREISLVVQPSDFIYEIRRQFKKLKNYKNFITQ